MDSKTVELDRPATEAGLAALARNGDFADGVMLFEGERAKASHLATLDQSLAAWAGPDRVRLLAVRA